MGEHHNSTSSQISRAINSYKNRLRVEMERMKVWGGNGAERPLFMKVPPGTEGQDLPRIGKVARNKRTAPVLPE